MTNSYSLRRNIYTIASFTLFLLPVALTQGNPDQIPLYSSENWLSETESDSYTFQWPIHKVAVIGAGGSGLIAYRELTQTGFDVRLFERDTVPGGNWHYTDEIPVDAPFPNADVSIGDYAPSLPPEGAELPYEEEYENEISDELLRAHRGPKPAWESLKTDSPPPLTQIREFPWPAGQPWPLPNQKVAKYIRSFASFHGINSNDVENADISYNTRVELVEKRFVPSLSGDKLRREGWTVTLKKVVRTGEHSSKAVWTKEDFDAVVVATGRFNAPYLPNIPGLKSWTDQFPEQIIHSRQYRRPQLYANKTVLVVGAGESGVGISVDLSPHVHELYQSIRPNKVPNPQFPKSKIFRARSPRNISIVSEIKQFLPPTSSITSSRIELANGMILTGIDSIIFATGFRYSFPFLRQFHNSSIGLNESNIEVIVTDGTHLRNLYHDILAINEPTLGFMCINLEITWLKYAEYIAVALSKVWANQAKIPSTEQMRKWSDAHVAKKGGYGKELQLLGYPGMREMIRFFVGWLNNAAVKYGGRQIDGEPIEDAQISTMWYLAHYGFDPYEANSFMGTNIFKGLEERMDEQSPAGL